MTERDLTARLRAANMVMTENRAGLQAELRRRPRTKRLIRIVTGLSYGFLPAMWLCVGILALTASLKTAGGVGLAAVAVSGLFPRRRVALTIASVGVSVAAITHFTSYTWQVTPPAVIAVATGIPLVIAGARLVMATVEVANEIGFGWDDDDDSTADEYMQSLSATDR